MKPYAAVLTATLALGAADSTAPKCTTGPVVDGLPVIYCPETWCYRDGECKTGALSRPFFEAPMLRPDFRNRIHSVPPRKLYRPKRDVTE